MKSQIFFQCLVKNLGGGGNQSGRYLNQRLPKIILYYLSKKFDGSTWPFVDSSGRAFYVDGLRPLAC
jgi:hypothetical protein